MDLELHPSAVFRLDPAVDIPVARIEPLLEGVSIPNFPAIQARELAQGAQHGRVVVEHDGGPGDIGQFCDAAYIFLFELPGRALLRFELDALDRDVSDLSAVLVRDRELVDASAVLVGQVVRGLHELRVGLLGQGIEIVEGFCGLPDLPLVDGFRDVAALFADLRHEPRIRVPGLPGLDLRLELLDLRPDRLGILDVDAELLGDLGPLGGAADRVDLIPEAPDLAGDDLRLGLGLADRRVVETEQIGLLGARPALQGEGLHHRGDLVGVGLRLLYCESGSCGLEDFIPWGASRDCFGGLCADLAIPE